MSTPTLTAKELHRGKFYVFGCPVFPSQVQLSEDEDFHPNRLIPEDIKHHPRQTINPDEPWRVTPEYTSGCHSTHREVKIEGRTEVFVVQADGDLPDLICRTVGSDPVDFMLPRLDTIPVWEVNPDDVSTLIKFGGH